MTTNMGEPLVDSRYSLRLLLGEGGMGSVYEAFDVNLERRVALKLLARAETAADFDQAAREARSLASINHRGIPTVHTYGVHDGRPFFVMELVAGTPLRNIIAHHAGHGSAIPEHRAVTIALDVASALGASHAAGVLHRDIKTENVIIEAETGRTVLVDFGISTRREDASKSGTLGTPETVAPEIWKGSPPSIASDLYALGCLCYELFTARSPFADESVAKVMRAHVDLIPPPLSASNKSLAKFDPVIARALAKAPGDRFPTCAAFRAALGMARMTDGAGGAQDVTVLLPSNDDAVRILVVDDDPIFARVAKRAAQVAFTDTLVSVTRAASGEAAVASAEGVLPHLLLLDYNLPGMNGAETLSRIRSLHGGESVAVVVMSGAIGTEDWWRFSSLGVGTHVEKPANFDMLVNTILLKARVRGWMPDIDRERETPNALQY